MLDKSYYEKTDEIIAVYGAKPASLIPIIQDIQSEYRYLPAELLVYVAKQIGISEGKAYSVATFYENFSLEQKGKFVLKVCDGTACHVGHRHPRGRLSEGCVATGAGKPHLLSAAGMGGVRLCIRYCYFEAGW